MADARKDRVRALFDQAVSLDVNARRDFLERIRGEQLCPS